MKLPKIVILDEKDKRLHERSKEVTFPLSNEDKKYFDRDKMRDIICGKDN